MRRGALLVVLVANLASARSVVAPSSSSLPAGPFQYVFGPSETVVVASGKVTVTAEKGTPAPPTGYLPLRVSLSSAADQPMPVRLEFRPARAQPVTAEVELRPGERRLLVLPVPVEASFGQLVAESPGITEDGQEQLYFGRLMPPSRAVMTIGSAKDFEEAIGQAPTHGSHHATVVVVPPEAAPDELSAYAGFDAVVLTRLPLEEMTEAQRRALEAYVATGGVLVLVRPSRASRVHLPLWAEARESAEGPARYGFGALVACARAEACGGQIIDAIRFRTAAVMPKGPPPDHLRRSLSVHDSDAAMLSQARAPVGRFVLIIFAFTLAIGPGSLVVARRRSPAALLVTIPATALVTCAVIVGSSILQDGFSVHAAARSFTLLDPHGSRAITLGVGGFYANFAPGRARFSSTAALIGPDSRGTEPQAVAIDWAGGPRFGSDLLPSRSYREWGVLAVEPARARLVLRRSGAGLRIQNALGGRVRVAVFRTDGRLWRVANVSEGGEGQAHPVAGMGQLPEGELHASRFQPTQVAWMTRELSEGEFLAQVEGPGLLPLGGLRLVHDDSFGLVRGEVSR